MAELDVFRHRVASQVSADGWVIDGNYAKVRDLVWARADTVVWLDYSFALTFARLLRRTLARIHSGEELWNGNRERFAEQFLSRDSLLVWAITTYPRYRATFRRSWRATPTATSAWSGYGHGGMLSDGWPACQQPDKATKGPST